MSPAEAKCERDLIGLRETCWEGRGHWILVGHDSVCIREQRRGEPATGSVTIPRRTWDAMMTWYFKDQALPGDET